MKILITGATGMVGSETVRQALTDPEIERVTVLVRKPLDFKHPKLDTIVHTDFTDYSGLAPIFKEHEACIWCLGISQSQVNKEQYYVITYDYAVAAAKAMFLVNPGLTFLFLSGAGADSKQKSRILFARVKGETENALIGMHPDKLYIARPGGIEAVNSPKVTFYKKLEAIFVKLMGLIAPSSVISSVELACALLFIVKNGAGKLILENKDLKRIYSTSVYH